MRIKWTSLVGLDEARSVLSQGFEHGARLGVVAILLLQSLYLFSVGRRDGVDIDELDV